MLNSIVLIGRLTRDPDSRYTPSGKAVAMMRLAVDRGTTNAQGEKETDFIDVVAWERLAETVANHLQKGRLVAVQGRLQIRHWETDGGERRERAEVVAHQVRFLDRARDNGVGDGRPMGGEITVNDDDDVPF